MKFRNSVWLTVFIFSCTASTKTESDASKLKGFWKLLKFEVEADSGWEAYPWNKDGTGYLLYDGDGHGSLHITPKDYENFRWTGIDSLDYSDSTEIRRVLSTINSNYNYMASYQLDTVNRIVSHTRLSHSWPKDWGKTVQRRYEFVGRDTLLLFPVEGEQKRRLTWVRQD